MLNQAQLIKISRTFDNKDLLHLIKKKQAKLVRHSAWKKRHNKRAKQRKELVSKRNEKWIRDMEWKVALAPSAVATRIAQHEEAKNTPIEKRKEDQRKSKIRELSKQLSKLTKLRDLRRKKLETKGHFFAEDGNQFFNKVKAWHESSATHEDEQDIVVAEPSKKELTIHKEDTWQHTEIDKVAYKYWCEADQSLDALLKVRRLWDQYILLGEQAENRLQKVPPTFVMPGPPANSIWASYLL